MFYICSMSSMVVFHTVYVWDLNSDTKWHDTEKKNCIVKMKWNHETVNALRPYYYLPFVFFLFLVRVEIEFIVVGLYGMTKLHSSPYHNIYTLTRIKCVNGYELYYCTHEWQTIDYKHWINSFWLGFGPFRWSDHYQRWDC